MKWGFRIQILLGLMPLCALGAPSSADAWGNAGHQIVAYIAADNLDSAARRAIAAILRTPDDQLANAMATAATLPDDEFRRRDPSTIPWHFINLCLEDSQDKVIARCSGTCVVSKINEYASRLRQAEYDKWGPAGDLAFLIHFVGDIYQPLHAATNADQGGNCVAITPVDGVTTLHVLWDVVTVDAVESKIDSGDPRHTARMLERRYHRCRNDVAWDAHTAEGIAWSSKQIARSQVYEALNLPLLPCKPKIRSCDAAHSPKLNVGDSYVESEVPVAAERLAKAGFALATLLNSIWM
jgi:hypothetical protein